MSLPPAPALLLALLVLGLGGCIDPANPFGQARPDYHVTATPFVGGGPWNHERAWEVTVAEPVEVRLVALQEGTGAALVAEGAGGARLEVPDGAWDLDATIGGHPWISLSGVRVDATPPDVIGLEEAGQATKGAYTLGEQAFVESGATLRVLDAATGDLLGDALPVPLTGLADGLHLYRVEARDGAGNLNNLTVQVRAGAAADLPAGRHTLGIVARYASQVRLWDLSRPDAYLSRAAARDAVQRATGSSHLGSGTGIAPNDPAVQAIVRLAAPDGNTLQAARALYDWMAGHLRYDTSRRAADDLLTPSQTLEAGGGVCRDLAALYVSLLRGAGVPARLVMGHLAGPVDGFHAWVEFYGGEGHGPGPWVPVDVSSLGAPSPAATLQVFGILRPTFLELRAVTPEQEAGDWSQAITVSTTYRGAAPSVAAAGAATTVWEDKGRDLCLDTVGGARALAERGRCGASFDRQVSAFAWSVVQVLDYGVDVAQAAPGTVVLASLVHPLEPDVAPNQVDWMAYGSRDARLDPASGALQVRHAA
ncbi:MAG TPA: transglutaminase-like domain-containing protein [Candidatus Thermoplasmatota archaeon]|nr:transglutaminase-like domain-containing protein [Candidatus Thermoplasmatota archaeon]